MKKNNLIRIALISFTIYAIYLVLTIYLADYIMPPARQSIVFLNDVISKHYNFEEPKTIILGDSTAAFGYSAGHAPSTLSLAIFSGSFAEIYYAYKKYLSLYKAPKCVVLSASYNWAYHRDGRFWDIYAVNGFYSLEDLSEIYETSAKVKDFPATEYSKFEFYLKFLLYRMRLQGIHLSDIQDAFFKQSIYKGNKKFYKLMRDNSGSINKTNAVFPFIWEPHAHLEHDFQNAPLYDEYLKRIVDLANSKGTSVHWVQLPISAKVYNEKAQRHFDQLEKHLKPIILSSAMNTFDGEVKIFPDEQFFSATHLNSHGARRFTREHDDLFEGCKN